VLELAARHEFMIVEDDIYGDLQGRHAPRLASIDHDRRVVYVGGFSKTLAANLRVGFMTAHPALIRELRDIKALTGLPRRSSASAWSRASSTTELRAHAGAHPRAAR
jgi:DNA-binding transcriptional MocR family regulator